MLNRSQSRVKCHKRVNKRGGRQSVLICYKSPAEADRQTDNQLIVSLGASHVGAKADILSATDAATGDTQSFGCSFSCKSDRLNCFEFGEETKKPEDISTTKAAESH